MTNPTSTYELKEKLRNKLIRDIGIVAYDDEVMKTTEIIKLVDTYVAASNTQLLDAVADGPKDKAKYPVKVIGIDHKFTGATNVTKGLSDYDQGNNSANAAWRSHIAKVRGKL